MKKIFDYFFMICEIITKIIIRVHHFHQNCLYCTVIRILWALGFARNFCHYPHISTQTEIHINLPLVVADIGLMTSFTFHHVTLHRAKFDDKASPLNVFFGRKKAKNVCTTVPWPRGVLAPPN